VIVWRLNGGSVVYGEPFVKVERLGIEMSDDNDSVCGAVAYTFHKS
jgi:hypothetical protein